MLVVFDFVSVVFDFVLVVFDSVSVVFDLVFLLAFVAILVFFLSCRNRRRRVSKETGRPRRSVRTTSRE